MPIREYMCPVCGKTKERVEVSRKQVPLVCEHISDTTRMTVEMELVEFSVPAKRNPRYGEG